MLAKKASKWYDVMMQFKVPQDVLRADKIVGFLTLRQLIIVAVGGGAAYSLYMVLSKQYFLEVWLIPVVFIAIVTLAFAFFTYHDIQFEKLILIFIEYKFRPRARVWQKMKGDAIRSVFDMSGILKEKTKTASTVMSEEDRKKKLQEISRVVDRHAGKIPDSTKK